MLDPRLRRARVIARMSSRVGLAVVVLVSAGCGRSCKDHPYVPYTIDASPSASVASTPAPPQAPEGGPYAAVVVSDAGTPRLRVDGLELAAPAGTLLVSAFVADLDGDGAPD